MLVSVFLCGSRHFFFFGHFHYTTYRQVRMAMSVARRGARHGMPANVTSGQRPAEVGTIGSLHGDCSKRKPLTQAFRVEKHVRERVEEAM